MPKILFERTRLEIDWPEGGRLLDLCDRAIRAGIPFACRHANCGTCRVEVREGAALLEPPNEDEKRLLSRLQSSTNEKPIRLGCQLVVRGGDGFVRLWVLL
jgi:2Fe-2S ferredoxin